MPRLMSVFFTEDAVRNRTKTVTRRKGWTFLKPGVRLTLCRKVMGRKRGEPLERICEVEVVSVRRESLAVLADWYGDAEYREQCAEIRREGFNPDVLGPAAFVHKYFVKAQGMEPDDEVTRIEWRYLDDEGGR